MSLRACPLLVGEVVKRHVVLDLHLVLLAGGVDAELALKLCATASSSSLRHCVTTARSLLRIAWSIARLTPPRS